MTVSQRKSAHPIIALAALSMLLLTAAPSHAAPATAVSAEALLVDGVLVDGTYDVEATLTQISGPDTDGPDTVRGVLEVKVVRVGLWSGNRPFGVLDGTLTLDDGTVFTYKPDGRSLAFKGNGRSRFPAFGVNFQGGNSDTWFNFSNDSYPTTGARIEDGELAAFRAQAGRRTVGPQGQIVWEVGELNAVRR